MKEKIKSDNEWKEDKKSGDMVLVQSWGPMWLLLLWGLRVSESHFKSLPAYGETEWSHTGEKAAYGSLPTPRAAAANSTLLYPLSAHSPTSGPLRDTQYPSQRLTEDTLQKSYSWPSLISHLRWIITMCDLHSPPGYSYKVVSVSTWAGWKSTMAEGKPTEAWRCYPGLKVGEQGRWSLWKGWQSVLIEFAFWGGQGAWGLPQLDFFYLLWPPFRSYLCSLSVSPCSPCVFYSGRPRDKSAFEPTLFCGKSDPMLVNPSCVGVCPHLFPDCM